MAIEIVYANEKYFESYRETLDKVSKEKIYLLLLAAPNIEDVASFQMNAINKNTPVYYAIDDEKVIGWCDTTPKINNQHKHRASLGMGILPEYRGKGIGTKLIQANLDHAKKIGLEKIELDVFTSNTRAIALYKKIGFIEEGLIKNYRKLDNEYFDCLIMGRFL